MTDLEIIFGTGGVGEWVPDEVFDLFITRNFGVCESPSLSYGPRQPAK